MLFKIVTDSSANLPAQYIEQHGIEVLSLSYHVKDESFPSFVKGQPFDMKQFYDLLRKKIEIRTSLVKPSDAYDVFERLLAAGNDILYIGFSSGLSGTFSTVSNILSELSEKYPERKTASVDTLGASLGQGSLVTYAVRMQEQGKTLVEVRDWLLLNRYRQAHLFTVDDLFFLKRGGRINTAAAILGTLAGIKPCLDMDDEGRLINIDKIRGRNAVLRWLCDRMEQEAVDPDGQTVFIVHGDCESDALRLRDLIAGRLNVKEFVIEYLEPVIASHCGPGTLGLFYMRQG